MFILNNLFRNETLLKLENMPPGVPTYIVKGVAKIRTSIASSVNRGIGIRRMLWLLGCYGCLDVDFPS